jgi:CheY-like chemotaxis protein
MQQSLPLRILVVDDHHDGAEALGMILQYLGCEVRLTQSGEEAIKVAPTFRPQLVILDLNMPPGIDGYQTAAELKTQAWSSDATFVAHTGCTDSSVEDDVRKAGFGYLIPKPANATTFEALVNTLRARLKASP